MMPQFNKISSALTFISLYVLMPEKVEAAMTPREYVPAENGSTGTTRDRSQYTGYAVAGERGQNVGGYDADRPTSLDHWPAARYVGSRKYL